MGLAALVHKFGALVGAGGGLNPRLQTLGPARSLQAAAFLQRPRRRGHTSIQDLLIALQTPQGRHSPLRWWSRLAREGRRKAVELP